MVSDPIQNEAAWKRWIAGVRERKCVRSTEEPESYPVVCVTYDEWDARWGQHCTYYDFVHLEDFIRHDDGLLQAMGERYLRECEERAEARE